MSKEFATYIELMRSIASGKKHLVFGRNYVVLSKKAYESLVSNGPPEFKSVAYDEFAASNWIRDRFLSR